MGRWVEIERTWHDTALTNCTLCGRLVPRRAWMVAFAGEELPFCNEECEGLYRSYWLPKYCGQRTAETTAGQSERGVPATCHSEERGISSVAIAVTNAEIPRSSE